MLKRIVGSKWCHYGSYWHHSVVHRRSRLFAPVDVKTDVSRRPICKLMNGVYPISTVDLLSVARSVLVVALIPEIPAPVTGEGIVWHGSPGLLAVRCSLRGCVRAGRRFSALDIGKALCSQPGRAVLTMLYFLVLRRRAGFGDSSSAGGCAGVSGRGPVIAASLAWYFAYSSSRSRRCPSMMARRRFVSASRHPARLPQNRR